MRQDLDTQPMRRPLAGSLVLHVLVVALIGIGLPSLRESPPPAEEPVVVDLVPIAERSNPPPAAEAAPRAEPAAPSSPPQPRPREPKQPEQPEPKLQETKQPEPAEPRPAARREPPPPAQRKPEPKAEPSPPAKPEARAETRTAPQPPPKVAARPPEPEAKREPLPKTEPRPAQPKPATPKTEAPAESPRKPEAQKPERPQAAPPAAKPPAEAKPEPPRKPESQKPENQKPDAAQDFAAVQKTVSELKRRDADDARTGKPAPAAEAKPARPDADSGFTSQVAQALRSTAPPGNAASLPVTSSEIDAVRRQIERCWNMPAGAKDAAGLVIALRVEMNMDGTPRSATLDTASKGQGSAYFQAAADSARRAVLNPRCHPFKLPPDKFDRWRTITLIFNPREMAGT